MGGAPAGIAVGGGFDVRAARRTWVALAASIDARAAPVVVTLDDSGTAESATEDTFESSLLVEHGPVRLREDEGGRRACQGFRQEGIQLR